MRIGTALFVAPAGGTMFGIGCTGPDSVLGRIEGLRDGQPRAVDFPLRRERCPPTP
jgi:hypothetical protein